MHSVATGLYTPPIKHLLEPEAVNHGPQLELWTAEELADSRPAEPNHTRSRMCAAISAAHYRELDLKVDVAAEAIWCFMRPIGPPSFTPKLLTELISARRLLQRLFSELRPGESPPFKYLVGGSRLPGIYNLGGDLRYFIECIRAHDLTALRNYAHTCVDVAYHMTVGFHLPIITIALVQGDALGGGMEGALSFNVLVAERSAKFGFPEILFNLFPGMGAYSYISRKLDAAHAQKMILSGKLYSATELHSMGLIDVLAEDGHGEDAVRQYIADNRRHHGVHRSLRSVKMRVNPLSLDELRDVTDIWAEQAMQLQDSDLRRMERLMTAQLRRIKGIQPESPRAF
jgi:DSF synthase